MIEGAIGVFGLLLGMAAASVWWMHRRAASQQALANAEARAQSLDEQMQGMRADGERVRGEIAQANAARERAEKDALAKAKELESKQRQFEEQRQTLQEAEKRLTDTFAALSARSLAANNQQFLDLAKKSLEAVMVEAKGDVEKKQLAIDNLVKPIKETLEKQNAALNELEKKRAEEKSGLQEHLKLIAAAHEKLSGETGQLVKALRRPEQRGRWGEVQLRNVVELAGMTNHCDFIEQQTIEGEDGRLRPDMIIRLPGTGIIVADAKVALDAYFDALEAKDDETRREAMRRHARQFASHVNSLADKRYWDHAADIGKRSPQLVAMFVPLESALVAALEIEPELHAQAMQRHVLIATPTLLVAMLRAVAYGWRQEDVAANAREIESTGRDLYVRLAKFVEHFENVGKHLSSGSKAYNAAIGSLETNLLRAARRFKDRGVTTDASIEPPPAIEIEIRPIIAPELLVQPSLLDATEQ